MTDPRLNCAKKTHTMRNFFLLKTFQIHTNDKKLIQTKTTEIKNQLKKTNKSKLNDVERVKSVTRLTSNIIIFFKEVTRIFFLSLSKLTLVALFCIYTRKRKEKKK